MWHSMCNTLGHCAAGLGARRLSAAAVPLCALLLASHAAQADDVAFGDAASEKSRLVSSEGTVAETGGLGQPCRRMERGGALVFRLKCDPAAQNYLTVKFWGSDRDQGVIFLYDGDRRIGDYMAAQPELDLCRGEAAFPGRFYYATYMLPLGMTRGKAEAVLKLAALGGINPYAPAAQREQPLRGRTRGIYRAYVHTDPFLVPGPDEKQGAAPDARDRTPAAGESDFARLHKETDDAIARIMRWQLYGPEWDAAVARGEAPAAMTGALLRPTSVKTLAAEGWQDAVTKRTTDGNAVAMNALAIYANSYVSAWSRFRGDAGMLDRVARGLDFYSLAQGSDGGFTSGRWVGGPDRKPTGSCLEGFGTAGLGQAVVLAFRDLEAKGMLQRAFDHDGDPRTPPWVRRAAWAAMLARHRDYLSSAKGRGHATNQDMAQATAMWLANEAVRFLAPQAAWPRERAMAIVRSATGIDKDPLGGYWVTRKGLALEPWGTLGGGYCGNYGLMCVGELARLAELTGDAAVRARAIAAIGAASYFFYPSIDSDGSRCMRREEVISARNNNWPGRVDYGGSDFVAAALGDPVAARCGQLAAAQGRPRSVPAEGNAHFAAMLNDLVLGMESAEKAAALPQSAARLPMEDGQPDFAWADEQGQAVAVKDRDTRMYMSLNWRRGFADDRRDAAHARANNLARVHLTTAAVDRVATIAMESPYGFGRLYICRYGPYLVAMNASDTAAGALPPLPGVAGAAVDLVSKKRCDLRAGVRIPPATTVVLRLEDGK